LIIVCGGGLKMYCARCLLLKIMTPKLVFELFYTF